MPNQVSFRLLLKFPVKKSLQVIYLHLKKNHPLQERVIGGIAQFQPIIKAYIKAEVPRKSHPQ